MRDTMNVLVLLAPLLVGSSCDRTSSGAGGAPGVTLATPRESLGSVMVQVARRFEITGRAAKANRFELAEFEASELGELFETDVPNASLPKEGPTAHIPAMAKAFLDGAVPVLRKGAAAKDATSFASAFEHAASLCNACHLASAKGFIEVPSEPGKSAPDLDPLPPAAAPR
jgi:hypothetical protein